MYYIVGLGNPGEKYAYTRHNVGWLALDNLCNVHGLPSLQKQNSLSGRVTDGKVAGTGVRVLYPDTFMNNSGSAVAKFVPKAQSAQLIVLYDDVDLALGEVKVAFSRGSGGHNGVESIIKSLGTKDFIRVRIGMAKTGFCPWEKGQIKRPKGGGALERHVLGTFSKREEEMLKQGLSKAVAAVETVLQSGHVMAMNKFN